MYDILQYYIMMKSLILKAWYISRDMQKFCLTNTTKIQMIMQRFRNLHMNMSTNALILGQNQLAHKRQQKIKATANNVAKANIKGQLKLLLQKEKITDTMLKRLRSKKQSLFFSCYQWYPQKNKNKTKKDDILQSFDG